MWSAHDVATIVLAGVTIVALHLHIQDSVRAGAQWPSPEMRDEIARLGTRLEAIATTLEQCERARAVCADE
jgi:hypothetical protein